VEGKGGMQSSKSNYSRMGILSAGIVALCFAFSASAGAQTAGPVRPPMTGPGTGMPTNATPKASNPVPGATTTTGSTPTKSAAGPANVPTLPPPTIPIDDIIKKFAARESAFKEARGNYTYTQTVTIKDFGPAGEEGGEYHMVEDIVFTPEGKRYEDVKYAPASSLQYIQLSPEDLSDLRNIQPFVLTTEELPKYDVKYVDHEPVDELTAYVFDVAPKQIVKGQRYFQGKVWVEDKTFAIVKSRGKAVPDTNSNKFATFDTYRENIAGEYWFPTYTHADDVLHFTTGGKHPKPTQDARIIMTVKYENYKYFGVKVKLGEPAKQQDKPNDEEEPQF
jgi:hypothetical protein